MSCRSNSPTSTPHRLLIAVAVLGVCMLPVQYGGGAEVPHAHAVFQLWADAAHGSTDHHRRWADESSVHAESQGTPEQTVAAESALPDVPILSELLPAHERSPVIGSVAALAVALALLRAAPTWRVPGIPRGLRPRPETPPPRFVAALV